MAEKSETDETKGTEKVTEEGKGNAGDVDPEVAELQKDPVRIKSVLAALKKANKEAETRRLKIEADEKKALEEQGKFKEVSEREKAEKETLKSTFGKRLADAELRIEALAAGCTDVDLAILAADRTGIKVSDDLSTIEGVKEAIAALKEKKPILFAAKTEEEGTPAPGSKPPAPRAGFGPGVDVDKASPRDLINRGLNANKKQ